MMLAVGVALLVVVAVLIALAARRARRPARDAVEVSAALESSVPLLPESESPKPMLPEPGPEPEPEPEITWTAALTDTALDEAARLRLIDDLTLLASPWTIALLSRASHEETSPLLLARIEAGLSSEVIPRSSERHDRET